MNHVLGNIFNVGLQRGMGQIAQEQQYMNHKLMNIEAMQRLSYQGCNHLCEDCKKKLQLQQMEEAEKRTKEIAKKKEDYEKRCKAYMKKMRALRNETNKS